MEEKTNEKESLEQLLARHRKEQRELQARVTSKKKNATKKTRKGVSDECAELERRLRERQAAEVAGFAADGGVRTNGDGDGDVDGGVVDGGEEEGKEEVKESGDAPNANANANANGNGNGNAGGDDAGGKKQDEPEQRRDQDPEPKAAPRKRNRQKERLARRAAEQEAAAEAAEVEAAGMVDRRGVERVALQAAFAARGLVERDIAPDGHCLFAAVADQLAERGVALAPAITTGGEDGEDAKQGQGPPYRIVRRVAAAYMARHADDFVGFLDEPLDVYVAKMRDTAEWGGALELNALANAYGVEIRVVQDGRTEVITPSAAADTSAVGKGGEGDAVKTLWLAYYRHGYGLGEHYNSLRSRQETGP